MPSLNLKLLSGRSLSQAKAKVSGKFSEEYKRNVAICELDPEDLKSLGISPHQNIRVITKTGSVVVRAVVSSQVPHKGVAFMPYGPWANMVLSSETHGTGMPTFKGVEAEVTPAPNEDVLDLQHLVAQIRRRLQE